MSSSKHDTVQLPTPVCVICKKPIPLRGDYFYGAHNACARRSITHTVMSNRYCCAVNKEAS
jgi:hypothetical protein